MNAARLLALYDRVAEAPGAVGRMRRLVLGLAVRGRLVEQDPADEPASELLTQIVAHKEQIEVSTRYRRTVSTKPQHVDEMLFELPASWVWARFGDITISRDGERIPVPKSERQQRAKTYDYYGASGVIDKIDSYLFDKALLLIGEDGANLINRSTPIAFIARGKYWVNNHAHVLDGLNVEYLRYIELFINATDLKPFVTGTAQPKMNQAKMNSIPVALPPLDEQHRIVAKVDELMAICDRLDEARTAREEIRCRLTKASYARLSASDTDDATFRTHARFAVDAFPALTAHADQVKRLRQIILDLAVRGRLVEQDPADEPASQLLKRIAAEKERLVKAGKIRTRRDLSNGEVEDPPFDLPAIWRWCRLDTVGAIIGGGTPTAVDPANFSEPGNGVPWLTPADLGGYKDLYIKQGARDLTEKGLQSSSATMMPAGTVLFTSRAPIGYVAIAANPIATNQGFKSIVPYIADCSRFIALAMQTFARDIDANAPGTTFKEVSGKIVAGVAFPLPPLAEQNRIIRQVDELMALCDRLETNLGTVGTRSHHLLEALLRSALEPAANELDTADEPAASKPGRINQNRSGISGNLAMEQSKLPSSPTRRP